MRLRNLIRFNLSDFHCRNSQRLTLPNAKGTPQDAILDQSRFVAKSNRTLVVGFFCLGVVFLNVWRCSQLLYAQMMVQSQDETGVKVCGVATDLLHLTSGRAEKCPCTIAVTNSATYHYEILESIAAQLPLHYLNLNPLECDTSNVVFDFIILNRRPLPHRLTLHTLKHLWTYVIPNEQSLSWMSYFETEINGRTFVDEATPDSPTVKRTIGKVMVEGIITYEQYPIAAKGYHATIEASCPCSPYNIQSLNNQDSRRSCIFHETCPSVEDHPRAVWVSPYHEHFFIPTELPRVPLRVRATDEPLCLCVIGTVGRRNWGLLEAFLQQMQNKSDSEHYLSVRIKILGTGRFPDELKLYKDIVHISAPPGYTDFHQQVAADCDAILLLLTKQGQPQYFSGQNSLLRLTGAIPLVMAYHKPVLLHEDLHRRYEKLFSTDLVTVTHIDEESSFVPAMWALLDQLQSDGSEH